MIPYARQYIDQEDINNVIDALNQEFITTGPLVDLFESKLSEFNQAKTFVVNSGTAALHCAYKGIGISPGDEVIAPPNTFIATQATAVNLGARIVFADVDSDTGLISLEEIERHITKKTKAIVVVDYAGQTCDIDEIYKIIGDRDIKIIEDAAHSLGSKYKGKPTGSVADVTTFSFFATKNITTGEGGAVSAKDSRIFERARDFSRQGLIKKQDRFRLQSEGPWHQEVHEFGLNYRLTDFQCALGISQLNKVEMFKSKRQEMRAMYMDLLSGVKGIKTLPKLPFNDPMWHLFPIRVCKSKRSHLVQKLRDSGILTQVNYVPSYLHPAFQDLGYSRGLCPESEIFYQTQISLPLYVGLSNDVIEHVSKIIKTNI